MNGLDVLAITDHLEYLPHKDDIIIRYDRPFEIALPTAKAYHMTLLRGAEITRKMPPGHLNALFLKTAEGINFDDWRATVQAAFEQGAFIFWNHPGWTGQQADGVEKWYDEHCELVEKGIVKGIEVVNSDEYYPKVHQWCLDKKLTMLGNSDIHPPIESVYDTDKGQHRPMTLILAKENSEEAIRDALMNQRTVVYTRNWLIGEEKYLAPIFDQSVQLDVADLTLKGKGRTAIQVTNLSSVDFELVQDGKLEEISVPAKLTLFAGKSVMMEVKSNTETLSETKSFEIPYRVTNLKIRPDVGLPIQWKVNVTFVPKSE